MSDEINNRMEDCGGGRHVGWWTNNLGWEHYSLLIEVKAGTVLFSCCEGERAEKRISFVVDRATGVEIARALTKALGQEELHEPGVRAEAIRMGGKGS